MIKKLLASYRKYRTYNQCLSFKEWLTDPDVLRCLFSDNVNLDGVNIFLYHDENGQPSIELQIDDFQILIIRYSKNQELRIYWTAALLFNEETSAENDRFFVDATLCAIEDINLALDYGTVYLSQENNVYVLRFALFFGFKILNSKQEFVQTFANLARYITVNVSNRYQQFMNHVIESQMRQQQEFDVDS